MTNALYTIRPYRMGTVWAFDDAARGLQAEPQVAGMPQITEKVMHLMEIEGDQITIVFSDRPFPGGAAPHEDAGPGRWCVVPAE